jgi:hypothetical protein
MPINIKLLNNIFHETLFLYILLILISYGYINKTSCFFVTSFLTYSLASERSMPIFQAYLVVVCCCVFIMEMASGG